MEQSQQKNCGMTVLCEKRFFFMNGKYFLFQRLHCCPLYHSPSPLLPHLSIRISIHHRISKQFCIFPFYNLLDKTIFPFNGYHTNNFKKTSNLGTWSKRALGQYFKPSVFSLKSMLKLASENYRELIEDFLQVEVEPLDATLCSP